MKLTVRKETKVNKSKWNFVPLAIALVLCVLASAHAQETKSPKKQDADFAAQIKRFSQRKVDNQKYVLAYKFKKGDVLRWQHDHQTQVETRFGTASSKTSTRARPDYTWTVKNVDTRGSIRFDIQMERIKVLEQNGDAEQIHYDSDKDEKAPASCIPYKERLGRVCSTYSISPCGQVVDSKSYYNQVKVGGVGDNPVVRFPDKPIAVGHKWDVSNSVRAKDEFGAMQQVELRIRYELHKVVDGLAHITFKTTSLNPHIDETVRSQIVTHMTRGFVVFDIAQGKITNREIRWDERVIGYQGAESYMHYTAFHTEALVKEEAKVAALEKPAKPVKAGSSLKEISSPELEQTQTNALLQPMKKKKKVEETKNVEKTKKE